MRGKTPHQEPLKFQDLIIEGSGHEKMRCFIPQRGSLTNQNHLESEGLCHPLDDYSS